jgi:hypothetical protein
VSASTTLMLCSGYRMFTFEYTRGAIAIPVSTDVAHVGHVNFFFT